LRNYCGRVAVRKCGGKGNKACVRKVKVEIKKREKKFGKKVRGCGGKKSCVVRVCTARAVKVAKRKGKGNNYVRKLVKRYTKLNCTRSVRKSIRKSIKKAIQRKVEIKKEHKKLVLKTQIKKIKVKRQIKELNHLPEKKIHSFVKERAVVKCGDAKEHQDCRRRVRAEIKNKETVFRISAVDSCKCDATADKFHGESCSKIVTTCSNTCLKKACKLRSTLECKTSGDQTSCYEKKYSRCSDLHLK